MIVIGCCFIDECPKENNIPVFMIVKGLIEKVKNINVSIAISFNFSGTLGVVLQIFKCLIQCRSFQSLKEENKKKFMLCMSFISYFGVGWFILGKNATFIHLQTIEFQM
jgi:hypothetical protein